MLEQAEDFPESGPILIITLRIRREHGFLMPMNGKLPFAARGEVFRMTE